MGTFTYPITLIGPTGARETLEALVDTESSFTTVPEPVLERLGVARLGSVRLRPANGQIVERHIGAVDAELNGIPARPIICVFGDAGAPSAIGAQALQTFLLGVDPDRHELVPVAGWWA